MNIKQKNFRTRVRQRELSERKNIFARLPVVYALSRKQGQHLLSRAAEISIVEWRTLWDLIETGPLTIKELAEIQCTDHSLLSRALPRMQKKGLVQIRKNPDDGREMLVSISQKGMTAYNSAAPTMQRRREELCRWFAPSELEQFIKFLDRLEEFLSRPVEDLAKNELNE